MNIAIVEDEKDQQELLNSYISNFFKEIDKQYTITFFDNGESILKSFKKDSFDLVFMDIEFNNGTLNGIEVSKKLREIDENFLLIFVTNMANFAIDGYSVNAIDFIVKPVLYDPFRMKISKALKMYSSRFSMKNVLIPVENQSKQILANEIYYVEVSNHDLYYHTKDNEYKVRSSLKHALSILESLPFVQCNSCYLVNLEYVSRIEKDCVILENGENLKMPRTRRKEFLEQLGNYISGSRR